MVKLKRLTIHKFRQVKPGTVLEFADGFNLILGKNGTGKTTLLELLAGLFKNETVDVEATFEAGGVRGDIRIQIAPAQIHLGLADGGAMPTASSWSVDLRRYSGDGVQTGSLKATSAMNVVEATGEGWTSRDGNSIEGVPVRFFAPAEGLLMFALRYLVGGASGVVVPDIADLKSSMRLDEALNWLFLAKEQAIWRRYAGGALPFSTSEWLPLFSMATGDHSTVGDAWNDRSASMLEEIRIALAVSHVNMAFEVVREWTPVQQGPMGTATDRRIHSILVTRQDGATFNLDQLSFGQRHMFAVMWYLSLMPEAVFIDELANGLHHDWIEAAMTAIGERQAFLATQHPFIMGEPARRRGRGGLSVAPDRHHEPE